MSTSTQFWRDKELPYAESRRACQSRACYKPHSHPTYSIGAVDHGTSIFTGYSRSPVRLTPGSLVFVPPMQVHACNPEPGQAWSYQMLHLDAQWVLALRQEAAAQPDLSFDRFATVTQAPSIYHRFCALNRLLFSGASAHDKEAALIEFVGDFGIPHDQRTLALSSAAAHRKRLRPVLEQLRHETSALPSLTELAKMANMSRYQTIRAFRAATGLTPHAWQLNQRINQAREQLQAGKDLAEVAHQLGFADQSHFQRTFKAYAGVTPGSYRAKLGAISFNTQR